MLISRILRECFALSVCLVVLERGGEMGGKYLERLCVSWRSVTFGMGGVG